MTQPFYIESFAVSFVEVANVESLQWTMSDHLDVRRIFSVFLRKYFGTWNVEGIQGEFYGCRVAVLRCEVSSVYCRLIDLINSVKSLVVCALYLVSMGRVELLVAFISLIVSHRRSESSQVAFFFFNVLHYLDFI